MAHFFYAASFCALCISLALWFRLDAKKLNSLLPRTTFYVAGLLYGMSSFSAWHHSGAEWLVAFARDAAILSVFGIVSRMLAPRKAAFYWFLPISTALIYFGLYEKNKQSSSQNTFEESTPEIIVELKNSGDVNKIRELLTPYTITPAFPNLQDAKTTELDNFYAVDIPESHWSRQSEILGKLASSGLTVDQEINDALTLDPMETGVSSLAGEFSAERYPVNDPYADSLWAFQTLKFRAFFDLVKSLQPQKKARIAILDTGVDGKHADLKKNFAPTNARNDHDAVGHGTHCAGIAAAVTNNGTGIASFAGTAGDWVEIVSVKVLDDRGRGTEQSIIAGIIEAANLGADVISMSLGGPRNKERHRMYDEAVRYANQRGAVVVVAAGNENRRAAQVLPAASQYVITVSAVDVRGQKAAFSNWFEDYAAEFGVAAPGVSIFSTIPGNRYTRYNGTSMAAPFVSGIVGMMKALKPEITTPEVFQLLNDTGAETGMTGKTGKLVQPAALLDRLRSER